MFFLSWKNVPPPQNENGPTCCGIFTKKKTLYEHERDIEFTLSLIFCSPKNHGITKLVLWRSPSPAISRVKTLFFGGPQLLLRNIKKIFVQCLLPCGPSSFHLLIWGSTSIHSGKWTAGTPHFGGWEDDVPGAIGWFIFRFHVNYQGCIVFQCLHLCLLPCQNC